MEKLAALKMYFGHDAFRPGQEPLIDALLQGRDALGVMPTGAGKSMCYQIPALMLEGTALVVSPLISLMKDQVAALIANGVRAAYLNSSLTPGQMERALENAYGTAVCERLSEIFPIVCSANSLQVDGHNDNAWNQGLVFMDNDSAWMQPPGYVTVSYTHLDVYKR